MKFLKFFLPVFVAMFCMGVADAQMLEGREHGFMLTPYRMSGKSFQGDRGGQYENRQRRFVMPNSGSVYQKRDRAQQAGQPAQFRDEGRKSTRMTRDERRALRQQINEANQGIYKKKQDRPPVQQP